MKHLCSSIVVLLFAFLFFASAATKHQEVSKETFSFDYKSASTEKPGSAGVLIALIRPDYGEKFRYTNNELFKRLKASMASDVEELIIDKGFRLKGPYDVMDDMIFEDKKTTDIVVKVEIDPEFTAAQGGWRTNVGLMGPTYSYSGTASLVGKINLTGIEPLTGERIWSKSVTIPDIRNIPIRTEQKYATPVSDYDLVNDSGIYNAMGAAFQQEYKGIMDKMASHFNPEELRSLLPQIKELKSKKGY